MAANRLDAPDGKLYKIGLNKGYWDSAGLGPQRGYYIRWDLYQQLGYPQITTTDELCEVLAQMQALEPQNKSGQPTYAAGAWNNGIPDSILWPQALMMGYSTGPDNILAVDHRDPRDPAHKPPQGHVLLCVAGAALGQQAQPARRVRPGLLHADLPELHG